MGSRLLVLAAAAGLSAGPAWAQPAEPSLDDVMRSVSLYAAGYGEQAAVIVAVEKYSQRLGSGKPRELVAEFAIVKTTAGWVGYRDVNAVDGQKATDSRDRLLSILADPVADPLALRRLSDESARYNIGPISRNFNVPTTVLLLFQPANLARFTFKRSGTDRIDGRETWKIDFTEISRPTFTMTRAGADVPMSGTLWVIPADGTVVRTQMALRNFADGKTSAQVPGLPPTRTVDAAGGLSRRGEAAVYGGLRTIESTADFLVSYRWHQAFAMWLPETMTERYEGPFTPSGGDTVRARATATASYSEFKKFETGARIIIPQ
jgi:hypothetical protein